MSRHEVRHTLQPLAHINPLCQDVTVSEYKTPALYGSKVPFSFRMYPEEHRLAAEKAEANNISMARYIGALIRRDAGLPNELDNPKSNEKNQLPLDP